MVPDTGSPVMLVAKLRKVMALPSELIDGLFAPLLPSVPSLFTSTARKVSNAPVPWPGAVGAVATAAPTWKLKRSPRSPPWSVNTASTQGLGWVGGAHRVPGAEGTTRRSPGNAPTACGLPLQSLFLQERIWVVPP